ncbi:MAG: CPBP family glutamic-type intramembrane protease [Verrucomicrobiota bacterium]
MMMRGRVVWDVFRREFLDGLRDVEIVLTTFGLPLFIWVLGGVFSLFMFEVIGVQSMTSDKEKESATGLDNQQVVESSQDNRIRMMLGGDEIPGLFERLERYEDILLMELDSKIDVQGAMRDVSMHRRAWLSAYEWDKAVPEIYGGIKGLINKEEVDLLVLVRSMQGNEENFETVRFFEWSNQNAQGGKEILEKEIGRLENQMVQEKLKNAGLDYSTLDPLSTKDIYFGSKILSLMSSLLPLLLITYAVICAYVPAIASIAGEKEANTITTLMISPVHSSEVITGKFMNVVLFGMLGAGFNLLPFAFGVLLGKLFNVDINAELSLWPFLVAFICLLPMTAIYSALAMCVASCARSYKLSQSLMLPFMMLFLAPAAVTLKPDIVLNEQWCWIPIASLALFIKAVLSLEFSWVYLWPVLGVNILYAVIALAIAKRVIRLQGGGIYEEMSFLEKITLKEGGILKPNARFSFLLFLLLILGSIAIQFALIKLDFIFQISILMIGWLVLMPLGVWKLMKFPWSEMDWLKLPKVGNWGGAVLIGLGGWSLALPFFLVFPPPDVWDESFSRAFSDLMAGYSLPVLLLLFAVLPGVCEEFVFRGVLMKGFMNTKTMTPQAAIILTSICFGVIHFSFYRFIPTAILGVLLGFIVWKSRSVWPAVLIHIINNGMLVLINEVMKEQGTVQPKLSELSWTSVAPQLVMGWCLVGLGIWIVWKINSSKIVIPRVSSY